MASLIKHLRFLANTPKATIRILDGVLRTWLFRQNRLRNCQLALTFKCNHNCDICSSSLFLQNRQELTLKQWYSVVDQLKELGCVHFDLTGGEPTLNGLDFLKSLVSYINCHKDRIVSLATNATRIDQAWLKELKKAGLNSILFNLQALDADLHDDIVKDKGNLEKIISLIPLAKKEGLNVCINTCLGNYNIKEIEKLAEWCEKNNLFLLINLAAPTGNFLGKDVRIREFREEYYRMLKKYSMMRSDTTYNFRGPNLCPGGIEKIYITSYGEVIQCTFCQISFGNVLKQPLKDIYKIFCRHPLLKARYICKHSFSDEFRSKWVDPIIDSGDPPVPIDKHPNYRLFFP